MGMRHMGRELALKALYQIDLSGDGSSESLTAFFAAFPSDDRSRRFAAELVTGVREAQIDLDRHLADALEHWSIGRLSRVDHNILRIALYELIRMEDIPTRVTLDEAIELAKTYGDQESGRFVNGVLDQVATRLRLKDKGEDTNPGNRDLGSKTNAAKRSPA